MLWFLIIIDTFRSYPKAKRVACDRLINAWRCCNIQTFSTEWAESLAGSLWHTFFHSIDTAATMWHSASVVRDHDQAVIIVPTLLLFFTLVTLLGVCIVRHCSEQKQAHTTASERSHGSHHRHTRRHRHRHDLQGIDGEVAWKKMIAISSFTLTTSTKYSWFFLYHANKQSPTRDKSTGTWGAANVSSTSAAKCQANSTCSTK